MWPIQRDGQLPPCAKAETQSNRHNTIPSIESVPAWWVAYSNRHLSAMLRTADKYLDVRLEEGNIVSLVKCKECGKEVSNTARKCPHCGVANPAIGPGEAIASFFVGLIVIVAVAWWLLGGDKPSKDKKEHVQTKSEYELCVDKRVEEGMEILRRNYAVSFSNREVLRRDAVKQCMYLDR